MKSNEMKWELSFIASHLASHLKIKGPTQTNFGDSTKWIIEKLLHINTFINISDILHDSNTLK